MKRSLGYIKAIMLIALVALLFGFAEKRHRTRPISDVSVKFTQNENLYVTEEVVNKLLIQNKASTASIDKETLDLNKVEKLLKNHDMIENAEVFLTLDGKLKAKLSQRKPIGRVMGNPSFYLDRAGKVMPLSRFYSARVPILKGFTEVNAGEAFPIVNYIQDDVFLTRHVIGINLLKNGSFSLELRNQDFKLYFGNNQDVARKFNNFKAFYKKAQKEENLNIYKKVDLQFGNQVVATKK